MAALNHDIESERVRTDQAHKKQEAQSGAKKQSQPTPWTVDDPRVPLSVRAKPIHVATSWVTKWNEAHPNETPIPMPEGGGLEIGADGEEMDAEMEAFLREQGMLN